MKKLKGVPFDTKYFEKLQKEGVRYNIQETFAHIYKTDHWNGGISVSGAGSNLLQTTEIRQILPGVFIKYQIYDILDLPCGDFNWMKLIIPDNINYIGADIVLEIIEKNKKSFTQKNIKFMVLDIIKDKLPMVDLIFCRDCLVHLSFSDIYDTIINIKNSQIKYFITTTFTEWEPNFDIITGDWRPINLEISPFNFPKPELIINEKCTEGDGFYSDKSLALWKVDDI